MLLKAWVVLFFAVAISAHPNPPAETQQSQSTSNLRKKYGPNYNDEDIKKAIADFQTCFKNVIHVEQAYTEIDAVKTNRTEVDKLVKKYCDKTPQVKTCINTYVEKLMPISGQLFHRTFITITQLEDDIDYLCHNDGARLASFIFEDGIDCVAISQRMAFEQCGDKAYSTLSEEDMKAFDKDTISQAKICGFADSYFECLVTSYKSCDPATPGTIVEGLLSFMRKNTACNDLVPKN